MGPGPPYGKRDPYHEPISLGIRLLGVGLGSRLPFSGVPCPWGSMKIPLNYLSYPFNIIISLTSLFVALCHRKKNDKHGKQWKSPCFKFRRIEYVLCYLYYIFYP